MKSKAATLRDELGLNPLFVTQNGKGALVVQTHNAYQLKQSKIESMNLLLKR